MCRPLHSRPRGLIVQAIQSLKQLQTIPAIDQDLQALSDCHRRRTRRWMICILRLIQSNSFVSNSSIIKFSCRFSARLHPGQAQDPPVLLLSPGTTMNLVLIFSRPQWYIINSSVISCTVTPGTRTVSVTAYTSFSAGCRHISVAQTYCPNCNICAYCSSQSTFLLLSYLNISIVRRFLMHKIIS